MALQEERNEQPLRRWHARLARERQNLSASVEEALTDTSAHEVRWKEGTDEHDVGDTGMIRPLLSLQSRPLPVVRPGGSRAGEMASLLAISRETTGEAEPVAQGTMLSRVAQRRSSLLPAVPMPENVSGPAQVQRAEISAPPLSPSLQGPAPLSASVAQANRTAYTRRQTMVMPRVVLQPVEEGVELPAPEAKPELPVQSAPGRLVSTNELPRRFNEIKRGSGVFEAGQGEVMVMNAHVNSPSMVLVTLTSHPGPVVVQYISLHVGEGFTVHLTGPATVKTSFNYLLL